MPAFPTLSSRAVVFNLGQVCLPGIFAVSRCILIVMTQRWRWAEARDASEHPTMHRMAFITKNYLNHSVNSDSGKFEKPRSRSFLQPYNYNMPISKHAERKS